MRHKAAEITHNINNTLGPGTANEHTVQEVLQRRWALKMSIVVSHQKLTMTNWEPSLRLIILQLTTWEVANVDHSMVMWRFSQMGKVRKLDKWVPHELVRMKKKKSLFWSVVFTYSVQQWRTISLSDCDVRRKVYFIQQLAATSSVVGLRRSPKALPKVKFARKKGHGHYLVICCPSDPLQLSECQQNHCIRKVCSANRWEQKTGTSAASVGQQKGSICILTWPLTSWLPLLHASWQFFAGESASTASRRQKMLSKSSLNLKHGFLYYRNKFAHFFLMGKNVLILMVNGSYFDS